MPATGTSRWLQASSITDIRSCDVRKQKVKDIIFK
jgi:hypothetical protein